MPLCQHCAARSPFHERSRSILFPPAATGRLPPLPALHAPNGISLSRLLLPRLRTRSFNLFYWQRKEIIGVEIRRLSVFLKIRPQLSGWKGRCVSEEGSSERCCRVTQLPSPCASSPWKPVGFSFFSPSFGGHVNPESVAAWRERGRCLCPRAGAGAGPCVTPPGPGGGWQPGFCSCGHVWTEPEFRPYRAQAAVLLQLLLARGSRCHEPGAARLPTARHSARHPHLSGSGGIEAWKLLFLCLLVGQCLGHL